MCTIFVLFMVVFRLIVIHGTFSNLKQMESSVFMYWKAVYLCIGKQCIYVLESSVFMYWKAVYLCIAKQCIYV